MLHLWVPRSCGAATNSHMIPVRFAQKSFMFSSLVSSEYVQNLLPSAATPTEHCSTGIAFLVLSFLCSVFVSLQSWKRSKPGVEYKFMPAKFHTVTHSNKCGRPECMEC